MRKLTSQLFALVFIFNVAIAQQEQAGIDLAASFPQFTAGNVEPDLPADGFYWDKNSSGWGVGIEVQANKASPSGYFIFGTVYSYKEDGTPFWCAFSQPYEHNPDVNQWRDAVKFSNLKYGHNESQIMAEMNVDCASFQNGTPLNSAIQKNNELTDSVAVNLLWRTPSELEITEAGGTTHFTRKFGWYDDLQNPSLDWIMKSHWAVMSDVVGYLKNNDGTSVKLTNNSNVNTGFEKLDVTEHQNVKDFVGHQEGWVYYISTVKSSNTGMLYKDYATSLTDVFEPIVSVGSSNANWIVLIHDPSKNRVMLFTVAGDKNGELRPDSGVNVKFVADVTPDAEVLDFYAYHCEGLPGLETITGFGEDCVRGEESEMVSSMADWSPQNVHRSTMKMLKLRVGGEGYLYQKNNGESHSSAEDRIKAQLIEKGILPAG